MNDPNAATWQWRVNKDNRAAADHRYQERFGVTPPPPTERRDGQGVTLIYTIGGSDEQERA